MGNNKSKSAKYDFAPELTTFTDDEWRNITQALRIGSKQSISTEKIIQENWTESLALKLRDIWFRYIFVEEHILDKTRFAYLYKGHRTSNIDAKTEAIFRLLHNVKPNASFGPINGDRIKEYFLLIVASYLRSLWFGKNVELIGWLQKDATASVKTLKRVLNSFTQPLTDMTDETGMITCSAVEEFLRENRLVAEVIDSLLEITFGMVDIGAVSSLLPKVTPRYTTVLDIGEVVFLCSHLMKSWTHYWKLRFQNKGHGSNFTMLCEQIVDVGPTIIIVKDTTGHVFGCCASESWRQVSNFYGDCRCFLFQLKPELKFYTPTIYNQNFQYHNQNQHMLPNGFGMGGTFGSFGFWLDGDFGKGRCASHCSTFKQYSRLSGNEEFLYDHIEVWSINELMADEITDDEINRRSRSLIDDLQLKNALLAMSGRVPHSS